MIPLHLRIKDGRTFVTSRKTDDWIYLKCKNVVFCFATAKMASNNLHEIIEQRPHSAACVPDDNAMNVARFRDALKTELQRQFYRLKDLYDTMALIYPEGAAEVPFVNIKQSMKLWRERLYPAHPQGFQDFSLQLVDPRNGLLLEYASGVLSATTIRDANNDIHIGFLDTRFLEHVEDSINSYLMDSTYQTAPQLGNQVQLFTLMGVYHDHAIPLMWFLMSRKTEVAYTAVLQEIRRRMPNANFQLIGSDFEIAQRNAIRRIFPEAFIASCHFHYCRAILGKIRGLQLSDYVTNNEQANTFVRKLLALAFLPEQMITPAFEQLKEELPRSTFRRLADLIVYYNNFWINRIGPVGFSIFGLAMRTNNCIESYHSRLLHRLGIHPTAWAFICKLKHIMQLSWIDIDTMERGRAVQRQMRYISIYRNYQLQRVWRLLYLQYLTPSRFLVIASNLIGPQTIRKLDLLSRARVEQALALEEEFENAVAVNNRGVDPEFNFDIIAAYRPNERLRLMNQLIHLQNGAEAPAVPQGEEIANEVPDAAPPVPAPAAVALGAGNERGRRRQRRRRRRRVVARRNDVVHDEEDGAGGGAVGEPEAVNEEHDVNAQVTCVVCLMSPRSKAFVPCGHFACCQACADRIFSTCKQCPVCRAHSTSIITIFN